MAKRRKILTAPEIVPERVYMYVGYKEPMLVKVYCVNDEGHLRGRVWVDNFTTMGCAFFAQAILINIESDNQHLVNVRRDKADAPWAFADWNNRANLVEVTNEYINSQMQKIQDEVDHLQEKLARLAKVNII